MKSDQLSLALGILVLLASICYIDVNTGLGFTPWLLYAIPLGLTYWAGYLYAPLVVAAACVVLMFIGYAVSPPLAAKSIALTNRLFGTVTFLALGVLIVAYKTLAQRLSQLTEHLKRELLERTEDLGRTVRILKADMALKDRSEQKPQEADEDFTRHITEVLVAESRRLREHVGQLEERELLTPEDRLERTRTELERLGKQLEQFQRDLLRP